MTILDQLKELSPYFEAPWVQALGILILALVLTVVVQGVLRFVLFPLIKRTKIEVDDIIVGRIRDITFYVIPLVGLMVALTPFELETPVPRRILFSLIVLLVLRSLLRLIDELSHWLQKAWMDRTDSSLDDGLLPLLRKAVKAVVVILGILVILGHWKIEIGPMLGALGIGGLAIGLALNTSLANVFGGIQLILDRSINIGDKIMLESGEVGVVMDIGLRSTKMRTYDNEIISLPNSQLSNARVKNYTKPDISIRVTVNFGVAYGSDVAQVKELILNAIRQMDDIIEEPEPQVLFLSMGDYSLDMCARVWVDDYGKQFARRLEMTELVYNTLNQHNIEIPFPTRTVYTKSN